MAAPVWQTSTSLTGGNGTTAVIAIPGAPLTQYDVILVTLYKENTAAVTPNAGYTEKGAAPTTTAPQAQHTFWFRASGGETGNLTFSWTGSVFRAATAHRFTGCATTGDPIQDIITAFSNTNVATLAVSLAAGSGDTLLYLAQTNFAGGNSYTSPAGFTERSDIDVIGDTTKSNPGAAASGSVSQTAIVSGAMTSVLLSLASGVAADSSPNPVWTPGFMAANGFPPFLLSPTQSRYPASGPYDAGTAATGTDVAADNATATGVAQDPTRAISTGPGTATATGAAQAPSPQISASAGSATATGTANNATITTGSATNAAATTATGTGVANAPSPAVAPVVSAASATGAAQNTTSKVSPSPTMAAGTGTANNPTIQTGSFTNAAAGLATGTGAAQQPSAKINVTPGVATASGVANNPSAGSSVNAAAGMAAGVGTANGATVTRAISAMAGVATATGAASPSRWSLSATAQAAMGIATAFDVLISGAETKADSSAAVLARRGSTVAVAERTPSATAVTEQSPSISAVGSRAGSTPEVSD